MNTETSEQLRPRTVYLLSVSQQGGRQSWVARLRSSRHFILGLCAFASLALRSYAQASPAQPTSDQGVTAHADAPKENRDCSQTLTVDEQILKRHPDHAGVQLHLARGYLLCRQFQASIDTYQLVLHHDPDNLDALIGTGEAYNLLGEYAEAEQSLQQALRLAPSDAEAVWALSRTYFYESRLGDAEQLLKPGVRVHPRDFRLWESLGEVQAHQGRREDARRSLELALELNPKAKRAQILLQASKASEPALNVEFHD